MHEFRRANIKEMEPQTSDLFDYDKDEKSRRYDALKLESLFRFEATYKALKWGVMVGCMFAGHRYYRTRDVNNAAHWFSVMSAVSFFNIWVSYSLQEFVTEYGARKSISLTARNAYHENAYKHYVDRVIEETSSVDFQGQPQLQNDKGQALDTLALTSTQLLQRQFSTLGVDRADLVDYLHALSLKDRASLDAVEIQKVYNFEQDMQSMQVHFRVNNKEALRKYFDDVSRRSSAMDLQSYDFYRDPDCGVLTRV